jgi:hypothetical protein
MNVPFTRKQATIGILLKREVIRARTKEMVQISIFSFYSKAEEPL